MKNTRIFSRFVASMVVDDAAFSATVIRSFAAARTAAIANRYCAKVAACTRNTVPADTGNGHVRNDR